MLYMRLAFLIFFISASSSADPAHIEALESKVVVLEQQVADLTARLEKLECMGQAAASPQLLLPPGIPSIRREGASASLDTVVFPTDPTPEALATYVDTILRLSKRQNSFSSNDPQVGMLAKIGSAHVDMLISRLAAGHPDQIYLKYAIQQLAGEKDKKLILDNLPQFPELFEVVAQNDWLKDGHDILVREVRLGTPNLPREWIVAVAGMRDPTTYQGLAEMLKGGGYSQAIYDALKSIPEIDLDAAVAAAWKQRRHSRYGAAEFARFAAQHGHLDALEALVEQAVHPDEDSFYSESPLPVLRRLTGVVGTAEEIEAWYKANKNRLSFDKAAHTYVVGTQNAAASPQAASNPSIPALIPPAADNTQKWPATARPWNWEPPMLAIELPPNPNREQVAAYVGKLCAYAAHKNSYGSNDRIISQLAQIGHEYLDVLIEALDQGAEAHFREMYLGEAILRLAQPGDKAQIIAQLRKHPTLISVITAKAWEQDARAAILEKLAGDVEYLAPEWIQAACALKDPSTYPIILSAWMQSRNRSNFIDALEELPGLEPKAAVLAAWDSRMKTPEAEPDTGTIAYLAAGYGRLDALDYFAQQLAPMSETDRSIAKRIEANEKSQHAIRTLTGQTGTTDELKAWYAANKDHLRFDAEVGRFIHVER